MNTVDEHKKFNEMVKTIKNGWGWPKGAATIAAQKMASDGQEPIVASFEMHDGKKVGLDNDSLQEMLDQMYDMMVDMRGDVDVELFDKLMTGLFFRQKQQAGERNG